MPNDVALVDLGEYRLKDLDHPITVYQVMHPDLASVFPELRVPLDAPGNLPLSLTSFVGRDDELTGVEDLLRHARLVTLLGAGGTGKTRLATEAAAAMRDLFVDGIWFVELGALSDGALVGDELASTVGVNGHPRKDPMHLVAEWLRESESLIILDNCEHLVDNVAELAAFLLVHTTALRLLATSREPLRVAGEATFPVPTLPIPAEESVDPAELAQIEAVDLFAQRARSVVPGFEINDLNAAATAEVCRRLDGLPLALELAAARLRSFSVEQIARHLDDRFRLLAVGPRNVASRHQTLRAAIGWSYDLLDESEQRLFERLAVFTGSFTLEAAQEICAGNGLDSLAVMEILSSLVEKSLVTATHSGPFDRYRMLDTMREFSAEQLRSSAEHPSHKRHARYFQALVDQEPHSGVWVDRMVPERENLRAALQWSIENDDPKVALTFVLNVADFLSLRSEIQEGSIWLKRVLARPGPDSDTRVQSLLLASWFGVWMGDAELAEDYLRQAEAMKDRLGDDRPLPNTLGNVLLLRDLREAARLYEESHEIARQAGHPDGYPAGLGLAYVWLGEIDKAESMVAEQWELNPGHPWLRFIRGLARLYRGDLNDAIEDLIKAARDFEAKRDAFWEVAARVTLARALLDSGSVQEAEHEAADVAQSARRSGQYAALAGSLNILGRIAATQGELERAREHFKEVLAISVPARFDFITADALRYLGQVEHAAGHPTRAIRLIASGDQMSQVVGHTWPITERELLQQTVENLQASVGETTFKSDWDAGVRMTLNEVLEVSASPPKVK